MEKTKQKNSKQEDRQPQREITPPRDITPPASHRETTLPLVDVGSKKFEELCRDIIDLEFQFLDRKSLKRTSGVAQYGVDVEGFVSSGCPEVVLSAKCYRHIDAWEFRPWIEDFTKHLDSHWQGKGVKHFVLAITVEANDEDMNGAARKLVAELETQGIQFHLWDRFKITDLLLRRPHLIDRYFNRYWLDALSADMETVTPSITGPSNRGLAGMGPGLQFIAEKMEGLYLSPLNDAYRKDLDAAVADLRRGFREPVRKWLQEKKANPDIWNGLEPGTKSEGLRAVAMVALGDGDIDQCRALLDEADALQEPPDRTARAFLTSTTAGIKTALAQLGQPSGRKERELFAAFELADGRPSDALATLAPLIGGDVSSEVLRLRAIARFRLGDKVSALHLAKSAVDKSPGFAMPRFALGALRVGTVLANGADIPFVGMPNPLSRSLLLFNEDFSHHLSEALREFDRLIESVDGNLRQEAEVWKLAALLLNPETRSQGRDFARSLMARVPPDPVVVAWCLHYGLPIRRGRIRKLFGDMLRHGSGDESHVAVLALLSAATPKRALAVLTKFAPMFPDADAFFTHWREQFGDISDADGASENAVLQVAANNGHLQPLIKFLMSENATPEALLSGAELLASRGADQEINTIRDKLLELKTSRAVQIAAGAALNTGEPEASLQIMKDATDAGLQMAGVFVEMRLQARQALGHHHDLIEDLEALLRDNDDWNLREQLIHAHLRIGALEKVKEEAERAFEAGLLPDHRAVQLAYALRNVAPEFARKMLEKADWSELPREMSGALLTLSSELGLADLQDNMMRRIISDPDGNNVLKHFDSVEDVIDEINKMSDAYRGQVDTWLHGHIPAALAMSGHIKDFIKLFLADPDCRTSDIGEPIPMFLAGAERLETIPSADNGSERHLRIDLGALMLGHRLGILDLLDKDFSVWVSESVPTALDEMEGQFGAVSAQIVEQVQAIERSESAVLAVDNAPDNSFDIVMLQDSEVPLVKEAVAEILWRAYQAGHLTTELFDNAVTRLGIDDASSTRSLNFDAIIVSGGTLANLTLLGVIEQLARTFPIRILKSELQIFRRQLAMARDGERMASQLGDLRRKVSKKLKSGEWRTVVDSAREDLQVQEKPAPLRCLLEVFPKEQLSETLLWIEDRMLSRVAAANVTTVIPLVKELVRNGRLSVKEEMGIRAKLREWGYKFLPLSINEIATILERAPIVGDHLIENDDLETLRTWFATDVMSLRYTDQNSQIEQGNLAGEARRFHELLTLKDELLALIWIQSGTSMDKRRAQSRWIWSNLRLPYLPTPPGLDTPDGWRILVAVNAAKAMAMPLHVLLNQNPFSSEVMRGYFEWLSAEALDDMIDGDPVVANDTFDHVAAMLAYILDKDTSLEPALAERVQHHMRGLVRNYLSLMPDYIADHVAAKHGIADTVPSNRQLSLTVTDELSVPLRAFENGIADALANGDTIASVSAIAGDEQHEIEALLTCGDSGALTIDLKSQLRTYPVADATVALLHPDASTRGHLLSALAYRDSLGAPLSSDVAELIAKEADVEVRVTRYISEVDRDFKRWLRNLGQRIASRSELGIGDFDLPEPEALLKFLGLPPDFVGSSADLATAGMLIEKVGLNEAMSRLSALPVEVPPSTMALYTEHLKETASSSSASTPASLSFIKMLALATDGTSPDLISEKEIAEWEQQLRVFKQILRYTVWKAITLPSWQKLPDETMFCLAWLFADQTTRIVSPIGYQPENLDRWFANHISTNLIDYHRFRLLPGWIQDVLLKSTSTRMLSSFAAKLISFGAEVPDQLRSTIGRTVNGTFLPQPDVAAARVPPPNGFWIIEDAVPAFVHAGWMNETDAFARRNPVDILRVILDENNGTDPVLYALMVAVLLPLDAVDDVGLLDSLAARLLSSLQNDQITDTDPTYRTFLEVAAETCAKRGDVETFKTIITELAATNCARWCHDTVRLDSSEPGKAALKLLDAAYMFGSMGQNRALLDRVKEVVAIMRAIVDAWPGIRLAVLSVLDNLGSQLDADTACQAIWPTALELRARACRV